MILRTERNFVMVVASQVLVDVVVGVVAVVVVGAVWLVLKAASAVVKGRKKGERSDVMVVHESSRDRKIFIEANACWSCCSCTCLFFVL